jgi:hypothetical protein
MSSATCVHGKDVQMSTDAIYSPALWKYESIYYCTLLNLAADWSNSPDSVVVITYPSHLAFSSKI